MEFFKRLSMNKNKKYQTDILASIHETVSDLYQADLVDKSTMKEFNELCLTTSDSLPSPQNQTISPVEDLTFITEE